MTIEVLGRHSSDVVMVESRVETSTADVIYSCVHLLRVLFRLLLGQVNSSQIDYRVQRRVSSFLDICMFQVQNERISVAPQQFIYCPFLTEALEAYFQYQVSEIELELVLVAMQEVLCELGGIVKQKHTRLDYIRKESFEGQQIQPICKGVSILF